jgi:RimJ/RimL family protein N-acetyltransferase
MNKNYVFVYKGATPMFLMPGWLDIKRYEKKEEIPPEFLNQLFTYFGKDVFSNELHRKFSEHAVLWLGIVKGDIVSSLWSRSGLYISNWYVPLNDKDMLIYSIETFPEWRGKGIAPAMQNHVIRKELPAGGKVFMDCKIWNSSSHHAIEKAGFACMGIFKNLH